MLAFVCSCVRRDIILSILSHPILTHPNTSHPILFYPVFHPALMFSFPIPRPCLPSPSLCRLCLPSFHCPGLRLTLTHPCCPPLLPTTLAHYLAHSTAHSLTHPHCLCSFLSPLHIPIVPCLSPLLSFVPLRMLTAPSPGSSSLLVYCHYLFLFGARSVSLLVSVSTMRLHALCLYIPAVPSSAHPFWPCFAHHPHCLFPLPMLSLLLTLLPISICPLPLYLPLSFALPVPLSLSVVLSTARLHCPYPAQSILPVPTAHNPCLLLQHIPVTKTRCPSSRLCCLL